MHGKAQAMHSNWTLKTVDAKHTTKTANSATTYPALNPERVRITLEARRHPNHNPSWP